MLERIRDRLRGEVYEKRLSPERPERQESKIPLIDGGATAVGAEEGRSDEASPAPVAEGDSPPALLFEGTRFLRKAGGYLLRAEGGSLHIDLKRRNGEVDGRVGAIGPATILSFGGKRYGLLSPVVLDLDGDGVELRSRKKSHASFDMDGDGVRDDTGWIGRGDGLLVIDRNGDGQITSGSEISFLTDSPGATSDLDALSALDSNRDNVIDSNDERFGELKVWVDRNGNGLSDGGELATLADHEIESVSLSARSVDGTAKIGSNMLLATSTFTRKDGSSGTVGDVALAFRPSTSRTTGTLVEADARPDNFDQPGLRQFPEVVDETRLESQMFLDGQLAAPINLQGGLGASARPAGLNSSRRGDYGSEELGSNADYAARVDTAQARLVQALSSFGDSVSAMASQRALGAEIGESNQWLTIAGQASVSRLLTVS